jgi:hypothetical protein
MRWACPFVDSEGIVILRDRMYAAKEEYWGLLDEAERFNGKSWHGPTACNIIRILCTRLRPSADAQG